MNKIGIGIVGLSAKRGWAGMSHVAALARIPGFEIRGLTASSPQSAREAAEKYGVAYSSHDPAALAARPEIDLVVVAVKVPEHRAPVEAALNAGKMVYCEWPVGRDLAEAEALAALARSKDVRTFAGLQARFAPAVRYVRDLVMDGYVGDVLSTSVIATPGLAWHGPVAESQRYQVDRGNGATMLTIPCGHTLDALCWIFGELVSVNATLAVRRRVARVSETGEEIPQTAHDAIAISGAFPSGAVASVHFRAALPPATGLRWEVNGTQGTLLMTGNNGHLQFGLVKISGATGAEKELVDLPVPEKYSSAGALNDLSVAVEHAYRGILNDLARSTYLVPTFDDALRRHRMLDAIEHAGG